MPSALPRLDVSLMWPIHTCGWRHGPAAPCPRPGYWLRAGTRLGAPYPSTRWQA